MTYLERKGREGKKLRADGQVARRRGQEGTRRRLRGQRSMHFVGTEDGAGGGVLNHRASVGVGALREERLKRWAEVRSSWSHMPG